MHMLMPSGSANHEVVSPEVVRVEVDRLVDIINGLITDPNSLRVKIGTYEVQSEVITGTESKGFKELKDAIRKKFSFLRGTKSVNITVTDGKITITVETNVIGWSE